MGIETDCGRLKVTMRVSFVKAAAAAASESWRTSVSRWMYYASYFPQIGLRHDDTLAETPVVKEALRRLPEPEQDARNFKSCALLIYPQKSPSCPEKSGPNLKKMFDIWNHTLNKSKRRWQRKKIGPRSSL